MTGEWGALFREGGLLTLPLLGLVLVLVLVVVVRVLVLEEERRLEASLHRLDLELEQRRLNTGSSYA